MKKLDSKARNCPNCGAPLEAGKIKCEYCGTSYYDLSTMSRDEPFMLTFKVDDIVYTFKAQLTNASLTLMNDDNLPELNLTMTAL